MRNQHFGFLTRSDTNQAVQRQKIAKHLKFRIELEKKRDCTILTVKTKRLISCVVTHICFLMQWLINGRK